MVIRNLRTKPMGYDSDEPEVNTPKIHNWKNSSKQRWANIEKNTIVQNNLQDGNLKNIVFLTNIVSLLL